MYLKRLELQGFKSFADKVEFQFNEGVTIVVGPNGSGKSNIADSLRWVMGEQSAKSLRGAKMEDIIFAGSTKRKPVGMAAVSITFDNSTGLFPLEYNEVTVTRRVYRSGESDYLINKVPCRLRDIHELFMDTGIGKEAYSIIGQGKVEEILNAKPEERRVLVEEAAGIIKYRNRKHEAMRKLDETEQNLLRINDIIGELESQIEPLAEQAGKAKEYKQYKDELTSLEINLLVNQVNDNQNKLQDVAQQVQELQANLSQAELAVENWENKIGQVRLAMTAKDEEISCYQQTIYEEVTKKERTESKIGVAEERCKGYLEQSQRLQREMEETRLKLNGLDAEFQSERERLAELQAVLAQARAELGQYDEDFSGLIKELGLEEETLENQKSDVIDILNQMAELRNKLHAREAELEGLNRRQQQINSTLDQLHAEGEKISAELAQVNQNIQAEQAKIALAIQHKQKLEKQNVEVQELLRQERTQMTQVQNLLNSKTSRHKVLQDMQHEYEGYQKGVKAVMAAAQRDKLTGISGVVAELIKVPQTYETAVEVALGGALQNVVTRTDQAAKEAINYLKRDNLGRATFLPINAIKPYHSNEMEEMALKQPGAHGLAVNLIDFDPAYRSIMQYLLGRIVVVENIDMAVKIAQKTHYRVRLVTLDGDVINPGGSLSGGSYQKRGSNLLGRNREIGELAKQILGLEKELTQLKANEQARIDEGNRLAAEMQALHQQIQEQQIHLAGLGKDAQRLQQEKIRNQQQGELFELEQGELTSRISEIKEEMKQTQGGIEEVNQQNHQLQQEIASRQNSLRDQQGRRDELLNQLTTAKIKVAELVQEEQGLTQSLQRYNQDKAEYEVAMQSKSSEALDLKQKETELTAKIEEYKKELQTLITNKNDMDQHLVQLKSERETILAQQIDSEQQLKDLRQSYGETQNKLHNSEVKQAKLEMEVENGLTRLLEDFGLTYEEAQLLSTEITSRKAVTQRIQELRAAIIALGTVNLGAIEEYDRVQERYQFLTKQIVDLEEAKTALYGVISEMNEIMTVRFKTAFEAISVHFGEIFTQLFGGGEAHLLLTDQENLLETGVDIIAQPPGKKPQHLSLLSGGEKALTAIALLFAILKVKPSPFCVLDEIEASLDEANVRRFADFVKEFSRKSQFIVVTHRKGTMEVADVLYGVTMDESGVSKLVSMKLEREKVS